MYASYSVYVMSFRCTVVFPHCIHCRLTFHQYQSITVCILWLSIHNLYCSNTVCHRSCHQILSIDIYLCCVLIYFCCLLLLWCCIDVVHIRDTSSVCGVLLSIVLVLYCCGSISSVQLWVGVVFFGCLLRLLIMHSSCILYKRLLLLSSCTLALSPFWLHWFLSRQWSWLILSFLNPMTSFKFMHSYM